MKDRKCHRCGLCCLEVGRTFWKVAVTNPSVVRRWPPALIARARDGDFEDGNLPCEMLGRKDRRETKNRINRGYVCLLQSAYGYWAKPRSCRQYPFDGEKCFRQQALSDMD